GDHHDLVAIVAAERFGNEADADAFDFVLAGRSALKNRALCFHSDGEDFRILLLHESRNAGKCSPRADTNRNRIETTLHLLVNLVRGGLIMELRVRRILELQSDE